MGDPMTEADLDDFLSLVDNGSGYCSMEDIMRLLVPQTTKDLYSKTIPRYVVPRADADGQEEIEQDMRNQ